MERLIEETYADALKGEKVIVIFHKPRCSNCAKMTPAIQEFVEGQPDMKLYDVLVEPEDKEDEKSMPPSWILKKIPRSVTYPVVMCFSKGKKVLMTMGMTPVDFFAFPFLDINALSLDHAQTIIGQKMLRQQHEEQMKYINQEQQARMVVIERLMQIANTPEGEEPKEEDWELNAPTISEEEKKACEACQ